MTNYLFVIGVAVTGGVAAVVQAQQTVEQLLVSMDTQQ